MELDVDGDPARGLRCYLELVAEALGQTGPGWTVQLDPPVSAYLALDQRHPDFPGHETALLWYEQHGWALAVEPHGSGDLTVISYLGVEVLPAPATVAQFVIRETGRPAAGRRAGRADPPHLRGDGDQDDLPERLAGYVARPTERAVRDVACAKDGTADRPDLMRPGAVRVELCTAGLAKVLCVAGEIDLNTEDTVWEAIHPVLADQPAVLVIDLSEVVFLGSAGLKMLVRAQQLCEVSDLRVVAATRATQLPLHVTGLDTTLAIYPSRSAALSPESPRSAATRSSGA